MSDKPQKMFSMEWCMKMAGLEGDAEIGAGKLPEDEPMTREEALESAVRAILRFGERVNLSVDHGMLRMGSSGKKPATRDMFAFPVWHLDDLNAALAMPKDEPDPNSPGG